MTATKFTITQASTITGKGRTTLTRHMKAGKLAFEKNDLGHRIVDASELLRVYGSECDFERLNNKSSKTQRSESGGSADSAAIQDMQERLTKQYLAQIEHLQQALEKAQEGTNRVTLLLEKQTSDGSTWQASFESMKERHDREIQQLKNLIHAERNKSLWKKLFS